jgi:trimeric autotransporter adhesin
MKTTTLPLKRSINRANCQLALLLIPLACVCFALSPQARATCQEGCLTNFNTVLGDDALLSNTTGAANTANGYQALFSNTEGFNNTATGAEALSSNTTGVGNTAAGTQALFSNATGGNNTAIGVSALTGNTIGSFNTAIGLAALANNTAGSSNIALGLSAGSHLTTGSNNIDIGSVGVAGEAKTIRIGTGGRQFNTYIAGINGVTVAGGVGVIIDSTGHIGTVSSSAQYKHQIKPMDKASEAILSLKPVTFQYKHELDPDGIPQFGLVAEEVQKVNPDLVARDEQGKPYTVRYEAVNAMLLNEFLKEHRKVQELEANAVRQQKQIETLTAGLQKVSAQLEIMKPRQQTVSR